MREILAYLSYVPRWPRAGIFIALSSMATSGLNITFPIVYMVVFDRILPTQDQDLASKTVLIAMLASGFVVCFFFLMDQFTVGLRMSATLEIRNSLVSRMLDFSYEFFRKSPTGDLIQRLIAEADTLGAVLAQLFRASGSLLEIAVMVVLLACLNRPALLAYAVFAALYLAWTASLKRIIVRQKTETSAEIGKTYDRFFEMLLGVKQIKCLNLHERQVAALREDLGSARRRTVEGSMLDSVLMQGPRLFARAAFLAGLILSFLRLRSGEVSLGIFIWSVLLMNRIPRPFEQLSGLASAVNSGTGAARRLRPLMSETPEKSGRIGFSGVGTGIEFQGVTFGYTPGKNVLDGLDLVIPRGGNVAIVGESGSGKSSLVNLLLRLQKPKQGSVRIDRRDVSEYDIRSYRARIGFVAQDIFLFNDTIRRNIDLGGRLSGPQIMEICDMCQLSALIAKSPQGLDSGVGERAAKLSGGERQRIAIARVIAKDADVIVFDEATSALDPMLERAVREMMAAYRRLKPQLTVITLSHRPGAIADADRIHVLDRGKVVEQGTHEELIANRSHYWKLFAQPGATAAVCSPG